MELIAEPIVAGRPFNIRQPEYLLLTILCHVGVHQKQREHIVGYNLVGAAGWVCSTGGGLLRHEDRRRRLSCNHVCHLHLAIEGCS